MFKKIKYEKLNGRQKENYNFQKVAARLADYGFNSMRLSDDFHGADFIALHADGSTMLRVQLKGRLTFDKKYYGRGIHIAFREGDRFFIYPHDELRMKMVEGGGLANSKSERWIEDGSRSWNAIPRKYRALLEEYEI